MGSGAVHPLHCPEVLQLGGAGLVSRRDAAEAARDRDRVCSGELRRGRKPNSGSGSSSTVQAAAWVRQAHLQPRQGQGWRQSKGVEKECGALWKTWLCHRRLDMACLCPLGISLPQNEQGRLQAGQVSPLVLTTLCPWPEHLGFLDQCTEKSRELYHACTA